MIEADLPVSPGVGAGAVVALGELTKPGAETVLLCPTLESAAAAALPACTAVVALQGGPIDPLAACARALGRPAVVACTIDISNVSGRLVVDGNTGEVSLQ